MDHFSYQTRGDHAVLHAEAMPLDEVADRVGTPAFVYSRGTLTDHYRRFAAAFAPLDPMICYAVKACNTLGVLRVLAELGAGMDVVSGGELERAFIAGVPPTRIVFAGVGKTRAEIRAALNGAGSPLARHPRFAHLHPESRGPIAAFNAESEQELELIEAEAASLGVVATCHLRVNPDVDPATHAYTTTGTSDTKFGVPISDAPRLFARFRASRSLRLVGLHVHLGSPIYSARPYVLAIEKLLETMAALESQGTPATALDLGGGFGADYTTGRSPTAADFAREMLPLLLPLKARGVRFTFEPGRTLVGNAGVLLTRVLYTKTQGAGARARRFAICDVGMNALIRPALYQAFHFIWPVAVRQGLEPPDRRVDVELPGLEAVDVVGPICETGDFLAQGRMLPPLKPGDLLAVFTAGAYAMSMSSNYNDHPRPAEVLVDGANASIVRERQGVADLVQHELAPRPLER